MQTPQEHRQTEGVGATHEEPPCSENVEHANGLAVVVGPRSEGGKHHQDDGRDKQRVRARPVVREPPKRQLANDGAGEGDVADILLRSGVLVQVAVLQAKNGGDGANDLQRLKPASVSKNQALIRGTSEAWRDASQATVAK